MDLLKDGLNWLSLQQSRYTSSPVVYKRGGDSYETIAVLGSTEFEVNDESGFTIAAHAIDFIINAASLDIKPKVGDQIVYNNIIHEVLDLGDGCWRWCDPHQISRRIHTKQI